MSITTYEYEERAFLGEDSFLDIKARLDSLAIKSELDNKTSYFFVLPDVNVSIASAASRTVIKYKGGQLGLGNGFEEREFEIPRTSLSEAIKMFTSLLKVEPQYSRQFRINYILESNVEVALKYTQSWGFHLEIEKTYSLSDDSERLTQQAAAKGQVETLAEQLGIHFITNEEMAQFKKDSDAGIIRGTYAPEEFADKYGQLFS